MVCKVLIMKTVITKEIDGCNVVVGFDTAVIDPVTTKNKVLELVKETPEYTSYQEKALSIGEKVKEHILLLRKRVKTKEDETFLSDLQTEIESLNSELIESVKTVNSKMHEIHKDNLIYFNPKIGEDLLPDEVVIEHFNNLKENELLLSNGEVVPNHKGKKYLVKVDGEWVEKKVKSIGENMPNNARLVSDLSDNEKADFADSIERKRIKRLTPKQRQAEMKEAISRVLFDAANMKTQLEISEDSDPLGNSKKWFNEKKNELELKYA